MNRRELFRCLPLSLLSLPAAVTAAMTPEKPKPEEIPWVEFVCQRQRHEWNDKDEPVLVWECATRFKVLRGANPYCPNCGALQSVLSDVFYNKMTGIEVKS